MKPEPKFVPGERVLLESISSPELNGEATVLDAWYSLSYADDEPPSMAWLYELTIPHGLHHGEDGPRPGWDERAIRKIPPNTPTTFDESIWMPKEIKV